MRAWTAMLRMRRKKDHKLMIDPCSMWRTEGIVEPVMSTGQSTRMATMQMSRKKHRQPKMDKRRMERTKGLVLQSVKIGQYISDQ
jgi:hypothetical protein